jgi:nicotinate-nucleotide adenylyltransferase
MPRLPRHAAGLRIGLLGGSFNPPHEGHRMISLHALRRLQLDRVWWLVTPGNPLKETGALPSSVERARIARAMANDPRIDVTTIEDDIDKKFTTETLQWLVRRCPGVRFVWMMGADNLQGFHRWHKWQDIARIMPMAVFDRPGATLAASRARAAIALGRFRVPESQAGRLSGMSAPAWVFFHGKRSPLSSTQLRAKVPDPARSR